MAAESAQFNGANLVYILPKPTPDFCTNKMAQSKSKPLAKIAPLSAPAKGYGTPPLKPPKREREEDNEIVRCKRRLDFARLGLPMHKQSPVVAAKRNERERKRVKHINETFDVLKSHLPDEFQTPKAKSKELSKVEILRGAIDYIMTLEDMLKQTTNINFESQFSALIQASDDIGDLDNISYPGTPSSSSSNQTSKAVKDLLSSVISAAAAASPDSSTVSTPSQRVPELQMVDSPTPVSSIDSQTQSQLVPDVQQIVAASPAPSVLSRQCSTPQSNHCSTPSTMRQVSNSYVNTTQPQLINNEQQQQNYNSMVPNISHQQGFTNDIFSTDFSNLQCASNNNNNMVLNGDLNGNKLHDKNVLNNNNNKCDQYSYTLNLDCSYVPNIDMSSALSSTSTGYGNPVTPSLCSPAPSLISNASGGFQMDKGFGEDNTDFIDFASLLMGCDMK